MFFSKYDDIYFIEGTPEEYQFIDGISSDSPNFPPQKYLTTLDDIKENMALIAKNLGGNAVIKFKYSKKQPLLKKLFGIGKNYYQASGIIVTVAPEKID
jgi:hypothetical protein